MKAFSVVWTRWPDQESIGCHESAGKMRYFCSQSLIETGYAETDLEAFRHLQVRRQPSFDTWAEAQKQPRLVISPVAKLELERLEHEAAKFQQSDSQYYG